MIRLNNKTKIQVQLGSTVTTNELPVYVSYKDNYKLTDTTYGVGDAKSIFTQGTTLTDVISSAPSLPINNIQTEGIRDIDTILIRNADTVAATVTVTSRYQASSASQPVIDPLCVYTISVGDNLQYTHAHGWNTTDRFGRIKTTVSGAVGTGTVTDVIIASANGFAGTSDSDPATPTLTLSTTITGLIKGNGTALSAAVAGTDFQAPITLTTTGSSGLATFAGNVLNIPNYAGGGGTVTSVSVVTNQGVSGSVATATTTPAITLSLGALTGVASFNGLVITADTGVITTGTWNGTAIANANLANSSTTINGTTIALGASGTVTAAAGTLTGTTLNSTVVTSSLTAVSDLTTGSIGTGFVVKGVTMTLGSDATGDVYYRNSGGVLTRLAIGSAGNVLTVASGLPSWAAPATSGTVTSVAQSFIGGLISIAGSPITTSGTLALTVAGTSGGGVYFSSTSAWASTGLLAANAIMIGGGAGTAYATTTTGTGVLTALGVNVGSAGAFVTFNGALGTPSSGTLTNATGLPEGGLALTDITTANVSTTAHGFFPKLTSNSVYYVNNAGALVALALGAIGTVLTSQGATSAPTFAAGGGGGLTVGTTTIASGTTTRILYDNAGVLGEYTLTGTGTVVAMQTAPTFITSITDPLLIGGTATTSTLTLKPTSASGITGADIIFQGNNSADILRLQSGSAHVALLTAGTLIDTFNALRVTATMPTTITAIQNAVEITITSAGSSSFVNRGLLFTYGAGYTGSSTTTAAAFNSAVAGTGGAIAAPAGNFGLNASSAATTTGYNFGGSYVATNGNLSCGVLGRAQTAKNAATNIGVCGLALNTGTTPIQIGVFAGLMNADPTFASAALMCDNGSQTSDIFVCRDNGTVSLRHIDTGMTFFGGTTTPTAFAHIAAGTTAAAQLRLTAGVAPSSPNDGDIYYINTSDRLMFLKNATACEVISASAVTTEVVVADTTLTITYNGTTYKLLARA